MPQRLLASLVFLASTLVLPGTALAKQTLQTPQGQLRGVIRHGVREYRGIPYAMSPAGERRWLPPRPAPGWQGVRDATAFGPACPQEARFDLTEASSNEDCLSLNVSAPVGIQDGRKLPVVVWIPGGAFVGGSSNLYRLDALAHQGLVVVSLNYRLGVLGFMPHPTFDPASNGNLGLMDQRQALAWVQRNIAAFGGDPNNVTLAGESAGAGSICKHLAAPELNEGLFHKALVLSGGCLQGLPAVKDYEAAVGLPIAEAVGCTGPDALACLRRQRVEDLMAAGRQVTAGKTMSFGPSIGPPQANPRSVAQALRQGRLMRVPLLMGGARDELRLYIGYEQQSQDPGRVVTAANYPERLMHWYGFRPDQLGESIPRQILARFPLQNPRQAPEELGSVISHYNPAVGINNCLFLHSSSAFRRADLPVHQFEFADANTLVLGVGIAARPDPGMSFGAVHSSALNYLFPHYSNTSRINAPELPRGSRALASQMQEMVASFARSGEPRVQGWPAWPLYQSSRDVMRLMPEGTALHDASAAHACDFWQQLYPEQLGAS